MKKINRTFLLLMLLVMILAGNVFASENNYIITKEYTYQNNRNKELAEAYVEIAIGSGDFVQYQDDEYLTISPNPDDIIEDKFGNKYVYYNLSGLRPGAKFSVVVKRKISLKTYIESIPQRTNSEIEGVEKYLLPQKLIDSDNAVIVAKAKELTEDIASDYKKAEAIFEFINVNIEYDTSEKYANQGSVSALENKRGVCEEFATLFVAMCRSVNIPSRAVEGYWIQYEEKDYSGEKKEEKVYIPHVWAEIYLQDFGWVPVDPTYFRVDRLSNKKIPNTISAFCKMEELDHIANGIYCLEKDNRKFTNNLSEKFEEKFEEVDNEKINTTETTFNDLNKYEWAKSAINFLRQIDVVNGYSSTEFGPQNNISRIEFISMLARALRYKDTPYVSKGLVYYYPDYNQSHWSKGDYDYLMRCYQAITPGHIANIGFENIVEIFGEGKIDINKKITRAEVVALMDVFLREDHTIPKLNDIWGNKFQKSIVKAYNYGLIVGYPDMTFRPNNNITRAEIAVILERYIGNEIYNII